MNLPIPIAAVARGALAGVAGTAAMDLFWYVRQEVGGDASPAEGPPPPSAAPRAALGTLDAAEEPADWEGVEEPGDWSAAPAPARVGKQVYEGVTQRTLEARFVRAANVVVHWGYGMWWGGLFGLVGASARRYSRAGWGPLFGATVWGTSYLLLPITGLYRPVWTYPLAELAPDFAAHLIYGAGTATAFTLMERRRGG